MIASVLTSDPVNWMPHRLHSLDRVWPESNCYVDLWIELLHALGLNPVSGLAFTLTMDFEGDQWTFVKFPPQDLEALYGILVKELTIWRGLTEHVQEQLRMSRPVIIEVDAYALPDTEGISYRQEHSKTAIVAEAIDVDRRWLRYFHNSGCYVLEGADFDRVMVNGSVPARLPPYVEIVELGGRISRPSPDLARIALASLRRHLNWIPSSNPVGRYRVRLADDVDWLRSQDLAVFHRYAFANFRQCGAASELGATFLRWLVDHGESGLEQAALHLGILATSAKTLQFQAARAIASKRSVDLGPVLDAMESAWHSATEHLHKWRRHEVPLQIGRD